MRANRLILFMLWGATALGGCAVVPPGVPGDPVLVMEAPERSHLRRVLREVEHDLRDGRYSRAWLQADAVLAGWHQGLLDEEGRRLRGRFWRVWVAASVLDGLHVAEPSAPPSAPRIVYPAAEPWWTEADLERPEVKRWRKKFLADRGHGLRQWAQRSGPYHADIVHVLRTEGFPDEMWVLAVAESGMNLSARSRASAVGPWQFLSGTARHCGLLITADRDERRDWIRSTRAACRYLSEMRRQFGDPLLALAAFNCGPGNVRKAIRKAGSRNYWALDLPRETERYVPRFLALVTLLANGYDSEYSVASELTLNYDEVDLPYSVKVSDLARACEVPAKDLRRLNPQWLHGVTPEDGHAVSARVPPGAGHLVALALESGLLPHTKPVRFRVHRVKKGDSLWGISRKYKVSLKSLLRANNLSGKEVIRPGLRLRVPL